MAKKKKPAGKVSHRQQGGTGKFTSAFLDFAAGDNTSRYGPIATQGKFRVYGQKDLTKAPKGIGKSAAKDPEARAEVARHKKRGGNSVTSKSYGKAKKGK